MSKNGDDACDFCFSKRLVRATDDDADTDYGEGDRDGVECFFGERDELLVVGEDVDEGGGVCLYDDEEDGGDAGSDKDGFLDCFSDSFWLFCSVIITDDWLDSLCYSDDGDNAEECCSASNTECCDACRSTGAVKDVVDDNDGDATRRVSKECWCSCDDDLLYCVDCRLLMEPSS